MAAATTAGTEQGRTAGWWFGWALAGILALAVTVRVTGVLRAAGLYGLGNYDDGVHFAAALGLVNGLFPYRDFLLLHPPGVVLALAPFAALSWLVGEPDAMAVARVSWMLLGGLNAILCGLVLKPVSRVAALVAALFYALSLGAVYGEYTTLLEAPATTALLLAVLSTRLLGSGEGVRDRSYVLAGLLLGLSPALKIWGVVAVVVVVAAILARRGRRPALSRSAPRSPPARPCACRSSSRRHARCGGWWWWPSWRDAGQPRPRRRGSTTFSGCGSGPATATSGRPG